MTQDNRTSWQCWVYICLPTLDCSSRRICEYIPAQEQKQSISKTCDDNINHNYNPNRNFIPLYTTRIGVAKATYHICHIFSIILLLCSEFRLYPVFPLAEVPILQVFTSLVVAQLLTNFLWSRDLDPDTYALPIHSALMDLIGQLLLVLCFELVSLLGMNM